MFSHGLLLLSYRPPHISSLLAHVGTYLKAVNSKISKILYISLESHQRILADSSEPTTPATSDLLNLVPSIYIEAQKYAPLLDVRVLHHQTYHRLGTCVHQTRRKLAYSPEVVFTNESFNQGLVNVYLQKQFELSVKEFPIIQLHDDSNETNPPEPASTINAQVYDRICLGGTFDNLHNGHKIMLSTSQLKCQQSLTIGVTDRNMVRHKTLWELIESPEVRINKLCDYLRDTDPYIEYNVTPIQDPFGPAIEDESLQAIIVSEETIRGGQKINEIRTSKGMPELQIDVIKLLHDGHRQHDIEEEKVSSSSLRIRKLGTLIKEPDPRPNLPQRPYIIGLTGMIASGKSAISEKLRTLGAGILNVDLLAHKTYQDPAQPAFKEIVAKFGSDILDTDGRIDRRKLGTIVFNDEQKLQELNQIIWPKVEKLVEDEIKQLQDKHSVIVLEIALLIEAKWIHKVHQVWLSILDEKEAIRRLQSRNNLSEEEATKRVDAMVAAHEKVEYANVILCTLWPETVTWQQVNKAWKMLDKFVDKTS